MNGTQDGFRMEGQVIDSAGPTKTFENLTIYLYSSEGDIITQKQLGTYSGNSEPFSIQTGTVPEYIIIDSPTFWELDADVVYYERSEAEGGYASTTIGSRDELPVELPN